MAQVLTKISLLSRLAIAVSKPEQQATASSSKNQDSKYSAEIVAHRRAIEHVREVQANYQSQSCFR